MKTTLGIFLSVLAGSALAQTPAPVGSAQAATNKISMCTGCHGIPGYKTVYPHVYQVPMITGQQPALMVKALEAYKSGARSHPSRWSCRSTLGAWRICSRVGSDTLRSFQSRSTDAHPGRPRHPRRPDR